MIVAGYAAPELALRAQYLVDLVVAECMQVCQDLGTSNKEVANGDLLTDKGRDIFNSIANGAFNARIEIEEHFKE